MNNPHATAPLHEQQLMMNQGNVIHMEKVKKKKKKKTTVLMIPNQLIKPALQPATTSSLPQPPSMNHVD